MIEDAPVRAPLAYVRVGYQGRWSMAINALIDTGSPVTLVSFSLADRIGYPVAECRRQSPRAFSFTGGEIEGFRAILNLAFSRTPSEEVGVGPVLSESLVFLCDIPQSILVGQHDALERMSFEQRNHAPSFDFALDEFD